MKPIRTILLAAAGILALSPSAFALEKLWSLDGFDQPESVLLDPSRDALIVSNVNGAPDELNGKGYLSLVSQDGEVIEKQWVTGLDAPKGLAIAGGTLFVADMQRLHLIDVETGEITRTLTAEGAVFLNDVTVDGEGKVYVSDFMANRIYRYAAGELSVWFEGEPLSHPNGLAVSGDRLMVGNWGVGMQPDFTTAMPGSLFTIGLPDKAAMPVAGGEEMGNIDGLALAKDAIFASDWIAGKVFRIENGERTEAGAFDMGLADISAAGGTLYLPNMMTGTVSAYKY